MDDFEKINATITGEIVNDPTNPNHAWFKLTNYDTDPNAERLADLIHARAYNAGYKAGYRKAFVASSVIGIASTIIVVGAYIIEQKLKKN